MTRPGSIALVFMAFSAMVVDIVLAGESTGEIDEAQQTRCAPPDKYERALSYGDFRWYYAKDQMDEKYAEIYDSGQRLIDRARWNEKTHSYELVYRSSRYRKPVPITSRFIDSVRSHIERALQLGYTRHIFFPDMGHAHLLISKPYYDEVIRHIPVAQQHEVYIRALAHPETRFLYHTAEQLEMLDERHELLPGKYLGWRYYTRNLVGRNNSDGIIDIHRNLESMANTVCQVKSPHRYWSAGFHVSASKDGCFSYQQDDKTYRFDISLRDLPGYADSDGAPITVDADSHARQMAAPADVWGAHACW